MKYKNRQNQSPVMKVKVVVTFGEKRLVTGKEHEGAFWGAVNIGMYIHHTVHLESMHFLSLSVYKLYLNFPLKLNKNFFLKSQ